MPEALLDLLNTVYLGALIIVGLGLLIFIHEAGHFLMAKRHGVRVEAFSLGMGPVLWKRTWGETEYRISAIPLGGYVKMAGENIGDPKTGAPYELTSKPAWARFQIFAAGALMNLVIAFPIAILACLAGRTEGSPVIGSPSYADTKAGLIPGDKILEANGEKIASIEEYRKLMVALPQGRPVKVVVMRKGAEFTTNVTVMESRKLGTVPPLTTLPRMKSGSPADKAGLKAFDEIAQVNGQEPSFDPAELRDQLSKGAVSGSLNLTVRNRKYGERGITLTDLPLDTEENWIDRDWRLIAPVITDPRKGSPAADAGLQAGDEILKIGDHAVAHFKDILDAVESLPGKEVPVQFRRGAGADTQTVKVQIRFKSQTKGAMGIGPGRTSKLVTVAEDSPFHRAGLISGDELVSIEGHSDPATVDIAENGRNGPVKIKIKRESKEVTVTGSKTQRLNFDLAGFATDKGTLLFDYNRIERRWTFSEAIVGGLKEPIALIDMTFRVLGKLFVGQEDATGMSGPVGIFRASFLHADAGIGNFLWLLGLITVNLGIFNLLPVPVLDGGHILLLAIEKLKGAPPSPRFVERFQLVGLVLLLSLLIFVTVNDFRPGR